MPVELASKKSPRPHEASCGLAVVLPGGRRIEVHPDAQMQLFELEPVVSEMIEQAESEHVPGFGDLLIWCLPDLTPALWAARHS
ncbi:MAG: hypothetical protein WBC78_03815 [Candidatus Sulfotelmatobacter sp.]